MWEMDGSQPLTLAFVPTPTPVQAILCRRCCKRRPSHTTSSPCSPSKLKKPRVAKESGTAESPRADGHGAAPPYGRKTTRRSQQH